MHDLAPITTTPPVARDVSPTSAPRNVFTVAEVALALRCSKAHVHNLINGKVRGTRPLPSLWLGRRRLILRTSFEEWLKTSERN
jgi:excisionase family DNA binding protein